MKDKESREAIRLTKERIDFHWHVLSDAVEDIIEIKKNINFLKKEQTKYHKANHD